MRSRLLIAAAFLVAAPAVAEAQFTTVVAKPRPVEPATSAQQVAEARARADSTQAARLSDMRAWVDSAAGAIADFSDTVRVEVDSGEIARDTMIAAPTPPPTRPTTEFREGAPAPATATGLPTLALLGIGALGLGAMLLGRPRA